MVERLFSSSVSSLTAFCSLTCTFRDRLRPPPGSGLRTRSSCQGRPLQYIRRDLLLLCHGKGCPSRQIRGSLLYDRTGKGRPLQLLMAAVDSTLVVQERVLLMVGLLGEDCFRQANVGTRRGPPLCSPLLCGICMQVDAKICRYPHTYISLWSSIPCSRPPFCLCPSGLSL